VLNWIDEASKEEELQREVLSFQDYMDVIEKAPLREIRTSSHYLLDMLNHFGKDGKGNFKLFQMEHTEAPPIFGQKRVQEALVQNIVNFQEEGFNNKFILLVGPNGSSKSSLVRKFMCGAEEYSKTDDGALYSFSWIFPIDNFVKGSLGLKSGQAASDLNTFAYLEDKDITAILPSELRDHPILLIPQEHRRRLINEKLAVKQDQLDSVKKSYLYNGDLSKRNRMIYDALLKNYKGRHIDVLKHIRVERFRISKRYSSSAVTIEPQIHVDARIQQITMDKRLASLPPSLQSLNLFQMQGEAVLANRGVLEYSDLLKRPLDTYKYLLMTMETKSINLQGILTELDIFFIGTSNEVHLAAFKQHPDFNSFKGRFNFIRVPYLLDYREEEKIYKDQVQGLSDKAVFEPHALTGLCLFAVMTRLRCPQVKNFDDKRLSDIVTTLNPLEKSLFLAEGVVPERLDSESRQVLTQSKEEVLTEFDNENLYEGKFGISPRDLKNIIYKLANRHKSITIVETIEYLQRLITKKNDYDFLNMTPQADYHHPPRFIDLIKEHCLNSFDYELRDALGMVDERSYEDFIKRYIENVTAMLKGEKIKNHITGRYEEPDSYFIKEFETSIELKEEAEKFRSHLLSRLGAYALDNRGKPLIYTEVFGTLVQKLKESFRKEQKKVIDNVSRNLVFYQAEILAEQDNRSTPLTEDGRKQIAVILSNLQKRFGYSERGALSMLGYVIKERY
jgi:predicted Ser/Thr protein kinase